MKICHITRFFPPGAGGVETHNYTLAKWLSKKNHDVDIIVVRPDGEYETSVQKSLDSKVSINIHRVYMKRLLWMHQLRAIVRKIEKDHKIDVFDVHESAFILPFIFEKRRIILSLHFFELTCPLEGWPRPCTNFSFQKCWKCCGVLRYLSWLLITRIAIRKATKIMVKYEYLKRILVKSGVKEDKIALVPHWIDVESIRKKSSQGLRSSIKGVEKSEIVFAYFARLAYENGPYLLLEAFLRLGQKVNHAKLIFIGGGPLRRDLENFCERHNIRNKVIFLGAIPYEEVHKYLSIPDVIVSSHLYMNYNWALLEAMSTQKPIIATNVAATCEILIDNYNALLTQPTAESLCSKMMLILNNPKMAKEIVKNAYKTVKRKHGWKNLDKYEQLIRFIR